MLILIAFPSRTPVKRIGELAALIGIEDFRTTVPGERLIECIQAEINPHADRHPPGKDRR